MRWEIFQIKATWELGLIYDEIRVHPGRLMLILAVAVAVGFATYIVHRPEILPAGPDRVYVTVSGAPRLVPKPSVGRRGPVVPAPTRASRSAQPTDSGRPTRGEEPTKAPAPSPTPTRQPSPTASGPSGEPTPTGAPTGGSPTRPAPAAD